MLALVHASLHRVLACVFVYLYICIGYGDYIHIYACVCIWCACFCIWVFFLVVKNTFIFLPVFLSSMPACVFVCIGIIHYIRILACVYIWGNVSPDLSVTEDGLFPPKLKLGSLACRSAQINLVKSLILCT